MGNNAANNNGFYEEKTKTAQPIQKSNVMNVPANTEHWHGATAKSKMAHINITNFAGDEQLTWLNAVSDEDNKEVNEK
jgi:quercetin dioxygenase-like cupin family protein